MNESDNTDTENKDFEIEKNELYISDNETQTWGNEQSYFEKIKDKAVAKMLEVGHCARATKEKMRENARVKRDELNTQLENPLTLGIRLKEQVHKLVRDEVELTKQKITSMVKKFAIGAVCLVVALILALYMFGVLISASIRAFELVVPSWAAALITAGILLIFIIILLLVGINLLKKGKQSLPAPQVGIKKSTEAIQKGWENE